MTDAERYFPLAPEATMLAQFQKLLDAKKYLQERKIDAVAIGSKFEWRSGPTQLGQRL